MEYSFEQLREDILNLGHITSGWREYTPQALWPQTRLEGSNRNFTVDPNSPEAAAYDYFLNKYGMHDGPGMALRFFAIHSFVSNNLRKLERRGLLQPDGGDLAMAEDLLRFLLTCFQERPSSGGIPYSIYDSDDGLQLPFQDIMADFHRLRALKQRLSSH